jgi:hypothetical protein
MDTLFIHELKQTLSWMITIFKWQHEQSGCGEDYSPELKKAIEQHKRLSLMLEE